jgi:serine phosphatase RsbU (regulator of sigma subunit)
VPSIEYVKRSEISLAACAMAADSYDRAADFYAHCLGPAGNFVIVIGDVSGHGPEASPYAPQFQERFLAACAESDDPTEVLELVADSLPPMPGDCFATALVVSLEPRQGRMALAAAGHPPPLQLDDASVLEVPPGPPLGVSGDGSQMTTTHHPLAGGVLVLSDGAYEVRDEAGERFGEQRVRELLLEHSGADPGVIVSALVEWLTAFSSGELDDDVTVLAARTTAGSSA